MSPEHYLSTDGKGFLDLLTVIGYKYFMIPPKGRYLTILVPDAKLLKDLKAMIDSNDREQERKAYQILDLLFVPHNLANYSKLSAGLKESKDNMLELTNRHSDKFVITAIDAAKNKVSIAAEGNKMATLQPMRFSPVNAQDHAVVFMSITEAFPRIYNEKIKGGAKFEKFDPPALGATGGGRQNQQQDDIRYIKYLHILYNTQYGGCMLPAYAGSSSMWNMQWDYLPDTTRAAIDGTSYTPEFEQLVRTDKLPQNPMLVKYLTHSISHAAPMQLISQIADGVLKCSTDCCKKTCNQCFKIHTCPESAQCPMRGINVADLIRMLSVRGLVDHMSQLGVMPGNLAGLVDSYPVASLTNMAAATFADRGSNIMQYRQQLAQIYTDVKQLFGEDYAGSLFSEFAPAARQPASQIVVPAQIVMPMPAQRPVILQSSPAPRISDARSYHGPIML